MFHMSAIDCLRPNSIQFCSNLFDNINEFLFLHSALIPNHCNPVMFTFSFAYPFNIHKSDCRNYPVGLLSRYMKTIKASAVAHTSKSLKFCNLQRCDDIRVLKNAARRYLTFDIKSIDVIKDMIYGTLAS